VCDARHRAPVTAVCRPPEEILNRSLRTYREVLSDPGFGELYVGGARPERWRHVFASVQSLTSYGLTSIRQMPTRWLSSTSSITPRPRPTAGSRTICCRTTRRSAHRCSTGRPSREPRSARRPGSGTSITLVRAATSCCFAREHKVYELGTAPYLFLGTGRYVSHSGDRPIAITWHLDWPDRALHGLHGRGLATLAAFDCPQALADSRHPQTPLAIRASIGERSPHRLRRGGRTWTPTSGRRPRPTRSAAPAESKPRSKVMR
jgi:hypothetical protein